MDIRSDVTALGIKEDLLCLDVISHAAILVCATLRVPPAHSIMAPNKRFLTTLSYKVGNGVSGVHTVVK